MEAISNGTRVRAHRREGKYFSGVVADCDGERWVEAAQVLLEAALHAGASPV
jgi:hypothetical protein